MTRISLLFSITLIYLAGCGESPYSELKVEPKNGNAWNNLTQPTEDSVNVRDFGAKGDGTTDDTAAIQAAIDHARIPNKSGGSVRLPQGRYLLRSSLTLESTLLIGLEAGGWAADSRPLPTLVPDLPEGVPVIIAKIGASIHGIAFDFPRTPGDNREFGPGIKMMGNGISVTNVIMHAPSFGIVTDGTIDCGRSNLENIFIVNPRHEGVRFEFGLDIITMRNVEVWNYEKERLQTTTGFVIGHADEIRISNCAVVAAAVGFHFIETRLPDGRIGRVWGGMDNTTTDFCGAGVKIDQAKILRITGGSFWSHHYGISVKGSGDIIITGADIRANSNQCIAIDGDANVNVTGSSFKKNPGWATEPKIVVAGAGMVNLSGNTFDATSAGIRLTPSAKQVLIQGNMFESSPYPSLDDKAPDARKVIANNLWSHP